MVFPRKKKPKTAKPVVVRRRRTIRAFPSRRGALWTSGLVAAAGVLIGVLVFCLMRPKQPPAIATLTETKPGTKIERNGELLAAENGLQLVSGDTILTADTGMANLRCLNEATTFALKNKTSLVITSSAKGKRLTIKEGELQADVAPQPAGQEMVLATPLAKAVVLGTRFLLAVGPAKTRLEVSAGKVKLVRESDQRAVEVPGGYYAVVAPGLELAAKPLVAPPPLSETLPEPWQHQDIGQVGFAGDATYANGIFTVKGSGEDIWNKADAFHFVYQPLNGDGTIVARVTSNPRTSVWSKAGVMIRETLNPNSTYAMMIFSGGSNLSFQNRPITGEGCFLTEPVPVPPPAWVKLVRSGNNFNAFSSADGVNWTAVGAATINMAAGVNIGLAVTAHNNSILNTSTLDNVTVTMSAAPPSVKTGAGLKGE